MAVRRDAALDFHQAVMKLCAQDVVRGYRHRRYQPDRNAAKSSLSLSIFSGDDQLKPKGLSEEVK
jgi:hypothetical protein